MSIVHCPRSKTNISVGSVLYLQGVGLIVLSVVQWCCARRLFSHQHTHAKPGRFYPSCTSVNLIRAARHNTACAYQMDVRALRLPCYASLIYITFIQVPVFSTYLLHHQYFVFTLVYDILKRIISILCIIILFFTNNTNFKSNLF